MIWCITLYHGYQIFKFSLVLYFFNSIFNILHYYVMYSILLFIQYLCSFVLFYIIFRHFHNIFFYSVLITLFVIIVLSCIIFFIFFFSYQIYLYSLIFLLRQSTLPASVNYALKNQQDTARLQMKIIIQDIRAL